MTEVYLNIPNFEGLKGIYRANGNDHISQSGVTVCLHNYNEDFRTLRNTIDSVVLANQYASEEGINGRVVNRLILSDQSLKERVAENYDLLVRSLEESGVNPDLAPEIGYFSIDRELFSHVMETWNSVASLRDFHTSVGKSGKLGGKGMNMFLSSLLTRSLIDFGNGSILYLDTDYVNRKGTQGARQVVTDALPLSHFGATSVIGVFNRYHLAEDGTYERGGRVNAGVSALTDLLNSKDLCKFMAYACSGDQGWNLDNLDRIFISKGYSVEMSSRIQGHSYVSRFSEEPVCEPDKHWQVEIHGSDDVPIGKGKPRKNALEGLIKMANEIAEGSLATIGLDNFASIWPTQGHFIKDFNRFLFTRFNSWADDSKHRYGNGETVSPISGGFTDEELINAYQDIFDQVSNRFYNDEEYESQILKNDFIPSVESIRNNDGESSIIEMGRGLTKFYKTIKK